MNSNQRTLAVIDTVNLNIACRKILDKLPQTIEVKALKLDLETENKTIEQLELCLKTITLMKEYLGDST